MTELDKMDRTFAILNGPDFEYVGVDKAKDVKDYIAQLGFFLAHLNTCDFATGQKILFMRIQLETLYKQMEPFLTKLEAVEKDK